MINPSTHQGAMGYFQVLVVMNNAAVNIYTQAFLIYLMALDT